MALGIGAGGMLGLAFEVTAGTYVAPTVYFPIRSESLAWKQSTNFRRAIRGVVDPLGAVAGDGEFSGDIEMECMEDAHIYFAYATRSSIVKSGASNYTYVIKGAHGGALATPKTLSLTIVRNGQTFGYTNCVVGSQEFSMDNGMMIVKYSILGSDEATQSLPTATYGTTTPFGAGQYTLQIPTATTVTDGDGFTLSIDDGAENQYRLRSTGTGPTLTKFGDRSTTLKLDRDFADRTDYDAFKALTAQSITLTASKGTNNSISFLIPVSIKDTYEVALGGTGDLIRASITYQGMYDATTTAGYQITVKNQINIT